MNTKKGGNSKQVKPKYQIPQRNVKKNNGLPSGMSFKDTPPLSMLRVAWNDSPPTKMLVTYTELPRGKNGRPVKSGAIEYTGLNKDGKLHRFYSDQVLGLEAWDHTVIQRIFGYLD